VSETMAPAELLGLVGVEIDLVEREADGSWSVHTRTVPGQRVCCPSCGQAAGRVRRACHAQRGASGGGADAGLVAQGTVVVRQLGVRQGWFR
jgi:hypothetical protein